MQPHGMLAVILTLPIYGAWDKICSRMDKSTRSWCVQWVKALRLWLVSGDYAPLVWCRCPASVPTSENSLTVRRDASGLVKIYNAKTSMILRRLLVGLTFWHLNLNHFLNLKHSVKKMKNRALAWLESCTDSPTNPKGFQKLTITLWLKKRAWFLAQNSRKSS